VPSAAAGVDARKKPITQPEPRRLAGTLARPLPVLSQRGMNDSEGEGASGPPRSRRLHDPEIRRGKRHAQIVEAVLRRFPNVVFAKNEGMIACEPQVFATLC
jgi:hypothetical protein